jgi:hypothetical protein
VAADATRVPTTAETVVTRADAAAGITGDDAAGEYVPGTAPAAEPARRRLHVPLLAAAAVAVLLFVSVVGVLSRRTTPPPEPPPVAGAEAEAEAPVALPEEDELAALWADLHMAEEEDFADNYVGAIRRLRAAEAQATALLARFPAHPELMILADSARAQISATVDRCDAVRTVALRQNRTPPVCDETQ